jgi:hypothetical protein
MFTSHIWLVRDVNKCWAWLITCPFDLTWCVTCVAGSHSATAPSVSAISDFTVHLQVLALPLTLLHFYTTSDPGHDDVQRVSEIPVQIQVQVLVA